MFHKIVFYSLFLLSLQSCFTRIKTIPAKEDVGHIFKRPNVLAIFMDGTNNEPSKDPKKNTNVLRLHNLLKQDVRSFYIEGVGTDKKGLGLALGVGNARRVRKAYLFLSNNYSKGDSIFLFGFSRGAYSCRILSNLIYTAGILNLKNVPNKEDKEKLIEGIYETYRGDFTISNRRARIAGFLNSWNRKHSEQNVAIDTSGTVKIEMMGIWDTVEAFGMPDYKEEVISPNKNHLNQVNNINKAYHALALDDNRARIYTPILLTTREVSDSKRKLINTTLEEVWFSGSHTDIGGGRKIEPEISYLSLMWMLSRGEPYKLFRDTTISEGINTPVHNMQTGIFFPLLTRNLNRSIVDYYDSLETGYSRGKLKVHESVIKRLEAGTLPFFKTTKGRIDWFDQKPFSDCFEKQGVKRLFKKNCTCIEVAGNK